MIVLPDWLWWLPIGKVREVSPQTLQAWLAERKAVQLIDVRSDLEYRRGTIGNSCHIPQHTLRNSLAINRLDPTRPVVVICLRGLRSRPGAAWLRSKGYDAYTLQGGIMAWLHADLCLETPQIQE